jgi:ribosome-binding protein aMBF1 (putative translation factor)
MFRWVRQGHAAQKESACAETQRFFAMKRISTKTNAKARRYSRTDRKFLKCLATVSQELRKSRGLTQEMLAVKANVTLRIVTKLETAELPPIKVDDLMRISDALGERPLYLMVSAENLLKKEESDAP